MLNKVTLIGRLTRDVEIKTIPSGKSVANGSIATSKSWKDEAGNKQEKTEFHNLVLWGKQAEIFAQYTSKGSQVYIEGELTTRSWDDKETGKKRYSTDINVNDFKFLDTKKKQETVEVENMRGEKDIVDINNLPFQYE